MKQFPFWLLLLIAFYSQTTMGQEPVESIYEDYVPQKMRYWFDRDYTSFTELPYTSGTTAIDITALKEGFHTLHYQVIDDKGATSPVRFSTFFIPEQSIETIYTDYETKTMRYWFDRNYATATELPYISGTTAIDITALKEGFHTLHYQVIDDKGATSPVRFSTFFIPEHNIETVYTGYETKTMRYWFDRNYTAATELPYTSGTTAIDITALKEGFHTLHYQVIDDKGATSPVRFSTFFIPERSIETIYTDYETKTMRYWFDRDYTAATELDVDSGTIAIDITSLREGFHTLHYQVIDDKGTTSPVRFSTFLIPQRSIEEINQAYAVKTVRYWFDNDATTTRTDTFAQGAIALDLSFLPEGTHTLHYQVETADGKVSPVRFANIDRWLYDIYINHWTEYADSIVSNDPLFAQRPDLKLHFLPDDTSVRGHLTVDESTTLSLGKFVQTANWGNKNDGNKYTKTGVDYYHPTTLLNMGGHVRADSVIVKQSLYRDRWHFLSLPFNVNVSDISVPDGTYWALRSYDGEARAAGQMNDTWQNLRIGNQMEAGKGYIIQLTKEGTDKTSWLTFKALNDTHKNNIFTSDDVTTSLEEHQAEFAHNRSWNLVGNPYPSFFDTRCISQDGTIIVWNGNGYTAYSLTDDSHILMPFEAFFIQKPLNTDLLTFGKDGRQHTHEVTPRANSRRRAAQNRRVLNFTLTDGSDTDRSRVVISEQASMGYETDKDAPKFMESRPQMPQLYSVESGVQYAINERPMGDGQVIFSVYAPTDGDYRFSMEGDNKNMTVLDTETGMAWDLGDGDYMFTATEGIHHARLIVSLNGEVTSIAQVNAYDDGEIKVAEGQLTFNFMRNKHIKLFSLDGRLLYHDAVSHAVVKVKHGVYLIDVDGKTTKIMVK